ncbi:hypothetical protein [Niallia taxi]|uniref:hypothetical protein n=1 Tax=Niallia taxi TaxID=2499688 RepID=UPI00300B83A8
MGNKKSLEVLPGNPSREERITALFEGKVIKVNDHREMYYKLDKFKRLAFSYTNHPSSFHPFMDGFNYTPILDDFTHNGDLKSITVLM